jgi:hypothetical protein
VIRALAVVAAIAVVGCGGGGDDGGDDAHANGDPFAAAVTSVVVEVDYADGGEPYTGQIIGFGDTWDITVANVDRLFAGTRALTIPTTLGEMQGIGPVADGSLTSSEILDLADQHRDRATGVDTVAYYVLFVDSKFEDSTGTRDEVLGVSFGGTGVVAMFKPVIESAGTPAFPNLERFVEQAVMIHELGHAIGLVANGVATTSAHHDSEHGAHCTSDSCVMYYLNEGVSDAAQFARDYVISGDAILWGFECLGDVDALTGGP